MWNLDRPDITNVRHDLDAVFPVDADPVIATVAQKDAIELLYNDYSATLGRPDPVLQAPALSDELKQAIHDAYKEVQDRGKLSELRSALKLLATECPYCGFGQIQDLDHHLPKAIYKSFSIFPLNLVPCCTTCNRGKPRKPRQDPRLHMIHAYLEDLSAYEFLKANIEIEASGALKVTYEVTRPHGMSAELHARLVNHFSDFDLHERFPAQVNIYLSALVVGFEQAYEFDGARGIRSFLQRSADKNSDRFGRNDWRTALLQGLSDCEEFCDGGFGKALGY